MACPLRVAVIGGGYAGMAAAVTLADAGVTVTVYEAARHLGGRARRVSLNDVVLDNGLHILLGAYTETLRLITKVGGDPGKALTRLPLQWRIHQRFQLRAAALPAPLHLVAAFLNVHGASLRERVAALRFMHAMRRCDFQLDGDDTVSHLLATHRQGGAFIRCLWEPLCIAALNTHPVRASAQVFLNVIRDGLTAGRGASDLLLTRSDLSSLFPEPAAEHVRARGGTALLGHAVDAIELRGKRWIVSSRKARAEYDHVVCAVSPHHAAALLPRVAELSRVVELIEALRYQPIYTVYLQFTQALRLPAPMLGLSGIAQWLFDRAAIGGQSGLIAAVISADGAHQTLTQNALADAVQRDIERQLGPLPPVAWRRVIAEKRATFECTPNLVRPSTRTPLANLHLAGDYTASDYPATIESAVRSGVAAAHQVREPQL